MSSVSAAVDAAANWKWKYLLWLFLMFLNEYQMEFTRLENEDKERIITENINKNKGDVELEKARVEAKEQLANIADYVKRGEISKENQKTVEHKIAALSDFVDANSDKIYEASIEEIRSIEWFHWDLYFISDSFLLLMLFLMLAYDGNRYFYFGDPAKPFMYGLVRYAFKASVLWCLVDFLSNIFIRSERILKSEALIGVVLLYLLFIAVAIWEDVKKEIFKRKHTETIE